MSADAALDLPPWQPVTSDEMCTDNGTTLMRLAEDELHLWRVHLQDFTDFYPACHEVLDEDEAGRLERYRFEKDRIRFVLRRGLQRLLLSAYNEAAPVAVTYAEGVTGKPALAAQENLRFNASFSGQWFVLAVTPHFEIGVDIEVNRAQDALEVLAQENFARSEKLFLRAMPEERWFDGFYHIWTCKEAVLKAAGTGLIDHLQELEVSPDPDRPARVMRLTAPEIPAGNWQLSTFVPFQDGTGAIAYAGNPLQSRFFELQPGKNHDFSIN